MSDIIKIEDKSDYNVLVDNIEVLVAHAKNQLATNINNTMLETYWGIGRHIIEFEQNGKNRAEYGLGLLKNLSKDLTLRIGKGYSKSNLYNMRRLYEYYPKFQAVPGKFK